MSDRRTDRTDRRKLLRDLENNSGLGLGGAFVAATGTVIVSASDISLNHARGSDGSDAGTNGLGLGGDVCNLGTFLADALTVIAHNHFSDGNDDCFGC